MPIKVVIRVKSCPKCKHGDLALERDHDGSFWSCQQCGKEVYDA